MPKQVHTSFHSTKGLTLKILPPRMGVEGLASRFLLRYALDMIIYTRPKIKSHKPVPQARGGDYNWS